MDDQVTLHVWWDGERDTGIAGSQAEVKMYFPDTDQDEYLEDARKTLQEAFASLWDCRPSAIRVMTEKEVRADVT